MRKIIFLTALVFATPVGAAEMATNMFLGTTMQDVRTNLTNKGYQVRKSEMENGRIEASYVKNGKMGEIYVSPVTGKVTKVKIK